MCNSLLRWDGGVSGYIGRREGKTRQQEEAVQVSVH